MGRTTQTVSALQLVKWYAGRGILLFILLALAMGVMQLWGPPVYASRSTARVGATQSMATTLSPLAMLSSDNVEDELAVLESMAIREHTAQVLFLECKPAPAWQPNPFGYQLARIFSFILRTGKPLDYGKLDYPVTKELQLDFARMAKRKLMIEVSADGNYALVVNGREADRQPVGSPLSTEGLRISLDGFTAGTAQRWRLVLTEPELVAQNMSDALTVMRVGVRSNTIGVKCEELHPGLAARIVNTMMDFYIQRDIANKQQNSSDMLVYVDQQIASMEADIAADRVALEDLLSDQKTLIASSDTSMVAGSYLNFQNLLSSLFTERAQVKNLRERLENDEPLLGYYDSAMISRPIETELTQRILDAEQKLSEELLVKTAEHPDVIEIKQAIANRRADLSELLDESLAQIDNRITSANSDLSRYEELLEISPETSVELSRLRSDVSVALQVLGTLYAERQQVALQKESDVSPIIILDSGKPSSKPVRPRLVMAAFVSILFALLLTFALLIVGRLLDVDVRNAVSLTGRLGAPVLATLDAAGKPLDDVEARRLRLMLAQLFKTTSGNLALVGTTGALQAATVQESILQLSAGLDPEFVQAVSKRLVAAGGCGEAALYDEVLLQADGIILITSPGRKRLKQLAPISSLVRDLGYTVRGWILIVH